MTPPMTTAIYHHLALTALLVVVSGIEYIALFLFQGILRMLRVAEGWISAVVLITAVLFCGLFCLAADRSLLGIANILGVEAFLIGVYSYSQIVARQWYRRVKMHAVQPVARSARALYLLLRTQHRWFGWAVLITATGHSLYFVLHLDRSPLPYTITGVVAWAIVAGLTVLGLWIDWTPRRSRRLLLLHLLLGVAFFVAFIMHVQAR